ncbi:MAG: hypothetical protein V4733_05045 [Verrucomicrobiota bacterium]
MKYPVVLWVIGLGIAGYLAGFAGKRFNAKPISAVSREIHFPVSGPRVRAADPAAKQVTPALPAASKIRSEDSLDSIIQSGGDVPYSRLALWMLDASQEEIAAYWAVAKDRNRTNDTTDLIFIHWARLDPRAAIAAVAGTGNEHYAWWAWACHDPEAALAAAIAANSDRVNNVTWGIGEFHPDWLREHLDRIPASGRYNAFAGLRKWDDADKPGEILDFLKKNGQDFDPNIFGTFVRKDPWAAYDWLKKNGSTLGGYYGRTGEAMNVFVKLIGESQPEVLQQLADQTPSGEAKRKMEAVIFDNLLKTDPDAALEQAIATIATQAPRITAARLAAVGRSLLDRDPAKAFEIARQVFSVCPEALYIMDYVKYPNGSSGSGGNAVPGFQELIDGLMAENPAEVMELAPPSPLDNNHVVNPAFSKLAGSWAKQDLVSYTNWVNQQNDPAVRGPAASFVANELAERYQFEEAIEWAASAEKTHPYLRHQIFEQWGRLSPGEAISWLDSSNLSAQQKLDYKSEIESRLKHQ